MRLPDSRFSLTTEPERFNDLAWDLLLGAQEEARRWRHGEMDVEHLVLALLDEQRLRPLLDTLRLQGAELRDDLEDFCARQPTRSSNTLYVGDDLEQLLDVAEQERQQQGATSIDERHLLLALASDERLGGALLQRQGLSRSRLEEQLQPVGVAVAEPAAEPVAAVVPTAKASPVAIDRTADQPAQPSPEAGALAQYGRDLTALAKAVRSRPYWAKAPASGLGCAG